MNPTIESVFAIAQQKTASAWRDNQRRAYEQVAVAGLYAAGTAGIFAITKLHEETIRKTARLLEEQIRRALLALPSAVALTDEATIRERCSKFITECIAQAKGTLLLSKERPSVMDKNSVARATAEWNTMQHEILNSFDIMLMEAKKAAVPPPSSTNIVYNVASGTGARVNVNSTDHSTNVVTVNQAELFERLRRDIEAGVPADQRPAIQQQVDRMEKAESKSAMLGAYSDWVRLIASHATIFSAYIPALTQLLMS